MNAGCSLADSCKALDFKEFINKNPGRTVVTYINTTVEVKALSDIICTSSNAVKQVIEGSNIKDLSNATNAQVQIYILTSGVDFNIYSGEPVAVVQSQSINYTKLRQIVSDAKTALSTRFGVTVDNIDNVNQNTTSNSSNTADEFLNWLKTSTGF
jgi:hypothetical protein